MESIEHIDASLRDIESAASLEALDAVRVALRRGEAGAGSMTGMTVGKASSTHLERKAKMKTMMCKRAFMRGMAGLLLGVAAWPMAGVAHAEDKVTLLSNWYAQAEHGGFYQAVAKGIYKKYGMDVTIKMGGPQVNNMQLLVAGQADFSMGYDFTVMKGIEQGLPLVTVGTSFQSDLQGMMTHDDVSGLGGLKNKTILVAGSGQASWWPAMAAKNSP